MRHLKTLILIKFTAIDMRLAVKRKWKKKLSINAVHIEMVSAVLREVIAAHRVNKYLTI